MTENAKPALPAAIGVMLTAEDLEKLAAPLPADSISVKVQSFSKDKTKAMLICYCSHTDVYARIEQVDTGWSCSVSHQERVGDTVYVRMRMRIKGVERENAGEGKDLKEATSDALKRVAMLFGVARYLWEGEQVWVEYNDQKDKFRKWTYDDFKAAAARRNLPVPPSEEGEAKKEAAKAPAGKSLAQHGLAGKPGPSPKQSGASKGPSPKAGPSSKSGPASPPPSGAPSKPGPKPRPDADLDKAGAKGVPAGANRESMNRKLMALYRPYLTKFPDTKFVDLLTARYQCGETRLMTFEQLVDLVAHLEAGLQDAPPAAPAARGKAAGGPIEPKATPADRKALAALLERRGWSLEQGAEYMRVAFSVTAVANLTKPQFNLLTGVVESSTFEAAMREATENAMKQ